MLKMVQSNFNLDSFFSLNTKTVRSYYCNLSRWKFLRCVFPKAPKKTWSCVATVFGPFFLSTCAHMLKEKAKFNLRSFFAWTFGSSALFFLTSHSGTNKVQSNIWNQKQARSTLSFKKSFFFKVEVQNIWNQPKAASKYSELEHWGRLPLEDLEVQIACPGFQILDLNILVP